MITHTAAWRLHQVALTCGHSTSIRAGEHTAWCSWCGRTVSALVPSSPADAPETPGTADH